MSAFVTGAKSPARAVDGGTAGGVQVKSVSEETAVVDAGQTPAVGKKQRSQIKDFEKTYLTSASLRGRGVCSSSDI